MDLFDSMEVFVLTVERGSLSAAAEVSGISATMAGNHVRALEKRLGAQLLVRTTRRQHITPFGESYYSHCKEILRLVLQSDEQAQNLQSAPTGKLRISAPVTFGTQALMPALSLYMARYPDVAVDVVLSDRVVDLVEEGFEAAIRIGHLPDSAMIAKSLAPYRLMMCAAPDYLQQHGTPDKPEELSQHACLSFSPTALAHWKIQGKQGFNSVPVSGRLQVNNGQALRVAALHGMGIILQAAALLEDDVKAGRLVQLFAAYDLPTRPMHIVYLQDRFRSAKVRSFVDFMVEYFGVT